MEINLLFLIAGLLLGSILTKIDIDDRMRERTSSWIGEKIEPITQPSRRRDDPK